MSVAGTFGGTFAVSFAGTFAGTFAGILAGNLAGTFPTIPRYGKWRGGKSAFLALRSEILYHGGKKTETEETP